MLNLTQKYQKLEKYLSKGQWKEADDETYRLMITAVGKKEGDWFTSEEMLNFPCEALKALDGLWVKYSNAHFGFSVQKKIYLEYGGILDGQYHKEAWNKFCHANGWKVNNQYAAVIFSTSAPQGHLPKKSGLCLWAGFVGWVYGLFSRIETCKL